MSYSFFKSSNITSAVQSSTPICPEMMTHSRPSSIKDISLFFIASLMYTMRSSSGLNKFNSIGLYPVTTITFIYITTFLINDYQLYSIIINSRGSRLINIKSCPILCKYHAYTKKELTTSVNSFLSWFSTIYDVFFRDDDAFHHILVCSDRHASHQAYLVA